KEPSVCDLDVPRRTAAVASAQNATSEDRFVKSKRSLDVGDGEEMCDGKSLTRRHLVCLILDLYFIHGRLQFGCGTFSKARRASGSATIRLSSVIECWEQPEPVLLFFVMIDEERRLIHCDHPPDFLHRPE